ncbi:D-Ala-D-Ala carboxypeptidase family metallohydrolase [Actinophytocola sp.]|uniref:D-Ala-D-Ala carboxypeptidase family metallohydrolase n=1 Tax=Actinophytocola sp. TaxID=1872138 RepID=UPI002D7EBD05|nr:D-Ala-D-Ala carboxypeptidase family metallohydrolase [Actinophytocola sp.]HET9137804.1 D-Ala-D-Ala carboxypeptidase family metallohydrolase [Actinophytocola sp.]
MRLPTRLARPLARILLALTMVAGALLVSSVSNPAAADGCYTWGRSLSQGATGEDVRQLQIRIAGYPGTGAHLGIDGDFGPATRAALVRFQQAYGLSADGVAGPQTFAKIYELQDDDCTPIHFTYGELDDGCGGSGYDGGPLSESATRFNALRTMWQLEAMRHALGDRPIIINSGFRSIPCNRSVGGASNSQHLYGNAADLGAGSQGFCRLAQQARNHGFGGILGPGYPDHNDHVHLDLRTSNFWSAPNCGVSLAAATGQAEEIDI